MKKAGDEEMDSKDISAEKASDRAQVAARIIGDIVFLLLQSPIHRRLSISDLEWLVLPALRLGQLRVVHDQRKPVAVVIWAKVSKEVDTRLQSGEIRLKPEDWNSGEHAWIVEILAPRLSSNQAAMQRILTETATAAFGIGKFKMRVADSKSKQSKIIDVSIRKKEMAAAAAI